VSFEVHPAPPSTPLAVPAGATGPLVEFAEHAALDPATGSTMMFVRVVQVNEGNGPAAPPPSIRLAVGAGPATAVGIAPTAIGAQPGTPAGIATLGASSDDVHLVEVEVLQPQTWHVQIANIDTRDHRYTWVVADSAAATLQPWLDVPVPNLAFEALTDETTPPQDVAIANYGPGPLTLNDPDGTDLGSGFRLLALTPHVIDGNHRAVASFGFTAPGTPGTPATTHTFASNDPAAGSAAGHGNRIALTATVHPRPQRVNVTALGSPGALPEDQWDQHEVLVVSVSVTVGSHVEVGQELLEVETAKVDLSVTSTVRGTVSDIRVNPDDTVDLKQTLMTIDLDQT
jgi:biotin carboxyl carrier protein